MGSFASLLKKEMLGFICYSVALAQRPEVQPSLTSRKLFNRLLNVVTKVTAKSTQGAVDCRARNLIVKATDDSGHILSLQLLGRGQQAIFRIEL